MITIDQLIEMLQDAKNDGIPGEAEVRLASQPNYPMQYHLDDQMAQDPDEMCVYLAEGGSVHYAPYLPGSVSQELGWR